MAIPTDTVYGLAADPFQPAAVRQLFRLKRRPEGKPILLLIDSLCHVEQLAGCIPAGFERLASRFWPGPLTVVLPAASAPEAITAGTGTVAVRWPGYVPALELIRAARTPLTGTSANISGSEAARSARQVAEQFHAGLAGILDGGPAGAATPSTIIDLTGEPRILREGAIPAAAVLEVLGGGR